MKNFKSVAISLFAITSYISSLAQVPDILNIDKTSGTIGEFVTISGSGFSENKDLISVHFGAAKGKVLNSTNYFVEVLAPAGATYQNVSVTNLSSGSTGYSKSFFNLAFSGDAFDVSKIVPTVTINEDNELFDMCSCDFNGDGRNDIATTNNTDAVGSTAITVYQNFSQPTDNNILFQKINDINLNTGQGARNATCADLDGDGKPELVIGKGGGSADRIYVFQNVSTTTAIRFKPFVTVRLSDNVSSSTTRRLKIHDLDRDGKPDIIMTDQGLGSVYIFGNKSADGIINFPTEAKLIIPTGAGSVVGLDVADLNNDNKPEIVCSSDKSQLFLLPNSSVVGSIKIGEPIARSIADANLVNIKIADLDNDGDKDIALTNLLNNIYVLVNTGNASEYAFSNPKYIETGRAPWGLDVGDLNGDGLVDIVVTTTDASDKLTALINTSTADALSYVAYPIGNTDISFNVNIADYNGDAKPDIGYINRKNNELVFLRNEHCVIADILPKDPPAICSGKPVRLRATPAAKVKYIWTNTTIDQEVLGEMTHDVTVSGTYMATIISEFDGCSSSTEQVTLVDGGDNLPPAITVNNPGVACVGSTFTLAAELVGNVNYFWKAPNGTIVANHEITVTNADIEDGGRYALVLESGGCRTDPQFELVEISSIPAIEISRSAGELFCEGTSNVLSAPTVEQGQYVWKLNNTVIPGATSSTYSATESGEYVVSVTNADHCSATSAPLTLRKIKQPVASFSVAESACLNEQIQFTNSSTYDEVEPPVFSWFFGGNATSSEQNPTHVFTKAGSHLVILQVGYENTSCKSSYESTINVSEFVNLQIAADNKVVSSGTLNLCGGQPTVLSVVAQDGQVKWNTGATTASITVEESGIYSVSTQNTSCQSEAEIQVNIVDAVEVKVVSGDQRIESGGSAQLLADGAETYVWEPAESLDNPEIPNPIASPLETTEYTVTGWNSYGCQNSAKVKVFVNEIVIIPVDAPQAFTPNGDGTNDVWIINNIDAFNSCPIRIFNRKGQNVYESNTYNNDWNGYLNGKELPEGAYYYILSCNASEVYTGNVTLLR